MTLKKLVSEKSPYWRHVSPEVTTSLYVAYILYLSKRRLSVQRFPQLWLTAWRSPTVINRLRLPSLSSVEISSKSRSHPRMSLSRTDSKQARRTAPDLLSSVSQTTVLAIWCRLPSKKNSQIFYRACVHIRTFDKNSFRVVLRSTSLLKDKKINSTWTQNGTVSVKFTSIPSEKLTTVRCKPDLRLGVSN